MLATTELRWFFTGTIPQSVADWFTAYVCADPPPPPRVDYYLRLADDDSLGIKLRQGRIEIKQRTAQGELVRLDEQASGCVEAWRKWGFGLADAEATLTGLVGDMAHWLGVGKSRRWCLFAVGENGRISPAPSGTMLEQGCACELTEVRFIHSAEKWWSLGFEAFGTDGNQREQLLLVAQYFLEQPYTPALSAENSYSYPKWLQITAE
jgi:hypothetical protein